MHSSLQISYVQELQILNEKLQDQVTQLTEKDRQQDDKIENNAHFEDGQVFCGQSSNTWNNGVYVTPGRGGSWKFNTRSIPVVFQKSYPSPPLVYVALQVRYLVEVQFVPKLQVSLLNRDLFSPLSDVHLFWFWKMFIFMDFSGACFVLDC